MATAMTYEDVASRVIKLKRERLTQTQADKKKDWENLFNIAALDRCIAGFALFDNNFVLQRGNSIFANFLKKNTGYDLDRAIGKSYFDLAPGSAASSGPWLRHVLQTSTGRARYNHEMKTLHDQRYVVSYLHEHLSPLVDDRGAVVGSTLCCLDVTDKVISKESAQPNAASLAEVDELKSYLTAAIHLVDEYKFEWQDRFARELCGKLYPRLDQLKSMALSRRQLACVGAIEAALAEVTCTRPRNETSSHKPLSGIAAILAEPPEGAACALTKLTPTESRVAQLVVKGKSSKEIAYILGVSKRSIDFHRNNIRKKLSLTTRKVNLGSHLSRWTMAT